MSAGLDYLCPTLDHLGVTYNPWEDKTLCLCGGVVRDGNQVAEPHAAGGESA